MTTLNFIAICLLIATTTPTTTSSNLNEYYHEQENDNNSVTVDSTLVDTQNFTLAAFEYHQNESDYKENLTQPAAIFEHNNSTTTEEGDLPLLLLNATVSKDVNSDTLVSLSSSEEDTNHRADNVQEIKGNMHQRGGRRERMHDFIDKQLDGIPDKFAEIRDNDETVDNIFSSYQEIFERTYKSTQEKSLRRSLLKKHLMNIIKTNSNSKLTHKASINAFCGVPSKGRKEKGRKEKYRKKNVENIERKNAEEKNIERKNIERKNVEGKNIENFNH